MAAEDVRPRRTSLQGFSLVLAALLCFVASQPARAQPTSEEYRVKAAFLFHFAQLVDWPSGSFNSGDLTLSFCAFDDEPSRKELQNTLDGKVIGTRVLHVHLIDQPRSIEGCNILFLGNGEVRRQAAILESLRGLPVLTVGETGSFLSEGGMIRFRIEDDKVRFEINVGSADLSHLRISSRLLLLATAVTLSNGLARPKSAYAH